MTIENYKSYKFDHRKSIGVIYTASIDQKEEWELFDTSRGLIVSPENNPIKWSWLDEARGLIQIPLNKKLKLEIFKQIPVSLKDLENLPPDAFNTIDLSQSKINNLTLAHLQNLNMLKVLELTSTNINNEALTYLEKLINLEALGLSYTNIDNLALKSINKLKELKILWLNGTFITDEGLATLNNLDKLMLLGLSGTNISQASYVSLSKMNSLKRLYLYNCHFSPEYIDKLKKALPNCKVKFRPPLTFNEEEELLSNEELLALANNIERQELSTKTRQTPQPKKTVKYTDLEFWAVIDLLDFDYLGNDDKVIEPAVKYLKNETLEKIYGFENMLAQKLFKLDGIDFAKAIGSFAYNSNQPFVKSWFLKSRCCTIANGKDFYEKTLQNPQLMPKDLEFSAITNIAPKAYYQKTGDVLNLKTKYDKQTFANKQAWPQ